MYKIDYDVKLNEVGRPCIDLSKDYEDKPEDKFMFIELARYYLQTVHSNMDGAVYDEKTMRVMNDTITLLAQLGDEMAEILYGNMKSFGDLTMMTDKPYHIMLRTIEERDDIPEKGFQYGDKIYDRVEGLKVFIDLGLLDNKFYQHNLEPARDVYELVDGITNEHWVKL